MGKPPFIFLAPVSVPGACLSYEERPPAAGLMMGTLIYTESSTG